MSVPEVISVVVVRVMVMMMIMMTVIIIIIIMIKTFTYDFLHKKVQEYTKLVAKQFSRWTVGRSQQKGSIDTGN